MAMIKLNEAVSYIARNGGAFSNRERFEETLGNSITLFNPFQFKRFRTRVIYVDRLYRSVVLSKPQRPLRYCTSSTIVMRKPCVVSFKSNSNESLKLLSWRIKVANEAYNYTEINRCDFSPRNDFGEIPDNNINLSHQSQFKRFIRYVVHDFN